MRRDVPLVSDTRLFIQKNNDLTRIQSGMSLHSQQHDEIAQGKVDKSALLQALSDWLPADAILHETEDLRPYE